MSLIPRKSRTLSPFDQFFDDDMHSLLEGFFVPVRKGIENAHLSPKIDIKEQDGAYLIQADLPGLKKEDIDVSLHEGLLTISAVKEDDHKEEKDGQLLRRERYYGKYVRQIPVGPDIHDQDVQAEFKDGVLTIQLPKSLEQPKKVSVRVK